MTERERLIELIKQGDKTFADKYTGKVMSHIDEVYEFVADYLLANGVIVPPCKVGDVVYKPIITDDTHEPVIWDITITDISIDIGGLLNESYAIGIICKGDSSILFDFDEFGKTVFLTREEAEKALAEKQGKDERK